MPYERNLGRLPDACLIRNEAGEVIGYRPVHVRLFGGYDSKERGYPPWPSAGGRPPTVWAISKPPGPFEIEWFEVG